MQNPLRIFIDNWSYLDFKSTFGFRTHVSQQLIPGWVGWHFRRIQAYTIFESYYRNVSRLWLQNITEDEKFNRREYGDPTTVVDQILASLIGDTQHITVPESEGDTPDPAAQEQLDVLNNWAKAERFYMKLIDCERTTCKLGDGVYVLGWSEKLNRPRLRVFNPGFYFPVLDPTGDEDDDWPRRVHIAYEYDQPNEYDNSRMLKAVRRITWELREIPPDEPDRMYPWNTEPSRETVYYTDATWQLQAGSFDVAMDIMPDAAVYSAQDEDLEIDFIPIVHIPCQVAEEEHYGRSVLAPVLQIFDDLVSTDTDLQAASATTGTPPIALSGASAPRDDQGNIRSYGPGTVWETGDGTATVVDTSHSLDALLEYDKMLMSRIATNSHVPEALLGRVKPSEVPSGIAITLSFTPHSSMIREMRLVRDTKYALLLKFVSRFFQKNEDIAEIFDANVQFGSFLPADKQEALTLVTGLLTAKAVTLETAVRILMQAGFPIEDASEEVLNIQQSDFAAANELLNATGDQEAVRERLGLPPLPADLLNPPGPAPSNLPPGPPPAGPPGLPPTVPQPPPTPGG